jgi:hypothetical protein
LLRVQTPTKYFQFLYRTPLILCLISRQPWNLPIQLDNIYNQVSTIFWIISDEKLCIPFQNLIWKETGKSYTLLNINYINDSFLNNTYGTPIHWINSNLVIYSVYEECQSISTRVSAHGHLPIGHEIAPWEQFSLNSNSLIKIALSINCRLSHSYPVKCSDNTTRNGASISIYEDYLVLIPQLHVIIILF